MTQFFHRIFRGTILALMLLLAGTANLVSVSYDADDDEDTPPVTVELNLVAPCKKNIQFPRQQAHARAFRLRDEKPQTEVLTSVRFESAPLFQSGSPQSVVPLRT
jgi:hypothetical protein